ncbi:MAG: hypothetical protein ACPIOQ_82870, partial [Promethearchaeia archaeon]
SPLHPSSHNVRPWTAVRHACTDDNASHQASDRANRLRRMLAHASTGQGQRQASSPPHKTQGGRDEESD